MSDQDYPDLYEKMEDSVERVAKAAIAYEATLGGDENTMVPVNGYPDQPTIAGRVAARMDEITLDLEQIAEQVAAQTIWEKGDSTTLYGQPPFAVVDKFLRMIIGVKTNGAAWMLLDEVPGLPMISPYAWAITDKNGVVLFGIKWSGEPVLFGSAVSKPLAYTDGPQGGQDVFAMVDDKPYQITSSGDNFSPEVGAGVVNFLRRNGGVRSMSVELPSPGSIAEFVTTILHIISTGQSLAMGDTSTPVTTQQVTANRLLTIQDGVRLTNQDATLTAAMVAPFIPLVSKDTEIPLVQLAAQLNRLRALPSNAALLASAHGRNGRAIASLSKGTLFYNNAITAVTAAKAEATRLNYGYRVPFVDWIQGENDRAMAQGEYQAALLQLQSDYDTDIRAAAGPNHPPVPMLVDQISNWTSYNQTTCFVPLEQLQVALDYPDRFACAGPKYWIETNTDGRHLKGEGYTRLGAMHTRAGQGLINGGRFKPTHAFSAVRTGNVIILKFHTPQGPLVVDTIAVTDPGFWGIRFIDTGTTASVEKVELLGDNTVRVTLNAVPTGTNPKIGIADIGTSGSPGGPTTGARSCLRDSSPDLDGNGLPVYNWACHQQLPVTAA